MPDPDAIPVDFWIGGLFGALGVGALVLGVLLGKFGKGLWDKFPKDL